MNFKKIVYCSDVDLSLPNGPGVNEREFVESIDRIFLNDFIVVTPSFKRPMVDLINKLDRPQRRLIHLSKRTRNPFRFLKKQFEIYFALSRVYKSTEDRESTIFVFRAILFPLGIFMFTKMHKPNYALRVCGDGTFPFLDSNLLLKWFLKPINKFIMGFMYKNAVGCDAVTERHVNSLKSRFKGNFFHVDNGVNTIKFQPSPKDNAFIKSMGFDASDFIIGYTGNFPHIRGGDEIIEALYYLKQKGSIPFRAVIAGDDGGVEILRKKVKKYDLSKYVRLLGKVDYNQIPHLVNQLDLGVSFLDKQYRGASEQKVRQYLACGVPAIVSPGASQFVEEKGIGRVVEHLDGINNVVDAFLDYYNMDNNDRKTLMHKIREYALYNISVDSQNSFRISKWQQKVCEQK